MSQATKRKHVVKEVLGDYPPPSEKQQVVRVVASPGNNLHEVETEAGGRFLASMPTKFRKNIWIKRGDFLIVDPIEEGEKVKGEIACILYKDHIKQLRKQGAWPAGFSGPGTGLDSNAKREASDRVSPQQREADGDGEGEGDRTSEGDSEDDRDLFVNTNRRNYEYWESEESEEGEEEGGSEGVREGETERG